MVVARILGAGLCACLLGSAAAAHPPGGTAAGAASGFIATVPKAEHGRLVLDFASPERFAFRWTPGVRRGIALATLDREQTQALRAALHHVVSHEGNDRIDMILATEAALGVIERAPAYRDPRLYYITFFGAPSPAARWALRLEGHHLSINLTFEGNRIVSASPLFLGANPETVPAGPDKGLRALGPQVDLARSAFEALSEGDRKLARGDGEWFGGFLTSPGSRRARLGRPAGVRVAAIAPEAQALLRKLIRDFVGTITEVYADAYLARLEAEEWASIAFAWSGGAKAGETYYWRLQGKRFLIEHDGMDGGRHIHSVWRDAETDFGG